MTLEARRVPEDSFGSLRGCLVEGDPQSEKRARRIKQRAVAISIALQTLALTALLVFPLLGQSERIGMHIVTPIPPFRYGHPAPASPSPQQPLQGVTVPCRICPLVQNLHFRPHEGSQNVGGDPHEPIIDGPPGPVGDPNGNPFGVDPGLRIGPVRPTENQPKTERIRTSEGVQMAQLINRVEPAYPRLAIQIHREGRVELHAIISTDGTIESLEVVSGDPFFIQSTLSAVRQWRYRPTILNGHPVEVDTHITVIYTLSH